MIHQVVCLYCETVTGSTLEPNRTTVCGACRYRPDRSELREIIAGQRPWARPLSFWANRDAALSDDEAARAQSAWDRWQNWVRAFNDAYAGCRCSPEERINGRHNLSCDAPQRHALLAGLPVEDRTAYEQYRRTLAVTDVGNSALE
jgi:hypothetical protein